MKKQISFWVISKPPLFFAEIHDGEEKKLCEVEKQTIFWVKNKPLFLFFRIFLWELLNTKQQVSRWFYLKETNWFGFYQKMVCYFISNVFPHNYLFKEIKWFAFLSLVFFGFPSLQEIKVVCYLPINGLLFHIPIIPILILWKEKIWFAFNPKYGLLFHINKFSSIWFTFFQNVVRFLLDELDDYFNLEN